MYRFLLTPRWLGGLALAIAAAVVMVFLGIWQWHRYEERSAVNNRIDAADTVAAVRKLVEQDNVLLMADSIGTPNCEAVMSYLQERKIPVIACGTQTRGSLWPKPSRITMSGRISRGWAF